MLVRGSLELRHDFQTGFLLLEETLGSLLGIGRDRLDEVISTGKVIEAVHA